MNEKRFEVVQNSGNLLSETLKDPRSLLYYCLYPKGAKPGQR